MSTLDDKITSLPFAYPDDFIAAMRFTVPHEVAFESGHDGDYDFVLTEHDPSDPGGATKYGIDQSSNPKVDVASLDFNGAVAIYWLMWKALRASELLPTIAIVLFDADNNCGKGEAVGWLQEETNEINGVKEGDPGALEVDRNIGNLTIAAVNAVDPVALATKFNNRRDYYYTVEVRESLRARYLKGWVNRLNDLDALVNLPASTAAA